MRTLRLVALGVAVAASSGLAVSVAVVAPAFAQSAAPADAQPKPVALTQANIDGFLASQKDLLALNSTPPKTPDDKPDAKAEAAREAVVKKHGFANMNQYVEVSGTIGDVMLGIDPETKAYVGPAVVLKKQIADVQADTKMSAKDKKEALDELNESLKSASPDKPSQGNIDLVAKNFDALTTSVEAE